MIAQSTISPDLLPRELVTDHDLGDGCFAREVNGHIHGARIPDTWKYSDAAALRCAELRFRRRGAQLLHMKLIREIAFDRERGRLTDRYTAETEADITAVRAGIARDYARKTQAMQARADLIAARQSTDVAATGG